MRVADYDSFVKETDQYSALARERREEIAIYGLVGEIGSLIAAVKKRLLSESGDANWDAANDEIVEELGDIIWYCFSLAQISNKRSINILKRDIVLLTRDLTGRDTKSRKIQATLDRSKKGAFLAAAPSLPPTAEMEFDDYKKLAFLTARTEGRVLLEVCLAVLAQLGAELMRRQLPELELDINRSVVDRTVNQILGEVAWHVSALASLYALSLDDVVESNRAKVSSRRKPGVPTPLHDGAAPTSQRFPRKFEIAFVSVGPRRTRMYMDGRQVGDELTDNAYDNDGYRFHDVMHIANTAHLGWSPVFRKLLGRKRRYEPQLDEVEDGARANIVEELVVKAIHSEGVRLAANRPMVIDPQDERIFASREEITFALLKFLQPFVKGLEVAGNQAWEWENAIFDGGKIFHELRQEGQGTVSVDLAERTMTFRPEVDAQIKGVVVGLATAALPPPAKGDLSDAEKAQAVKGAVLRALQLPMQEELMGLVEIDLQDSRVNVRVRGEVQRKAWALNVIAFNVAVSVSAGNFASTVIALADPKDAIR